MHFALESTELAPAGIRFRPVAGHRFDVENYMRQEYTATSTDGFVSLRTPPGQHPRSYGAFVRQISHYVKEREAITLPFAIRSSTGLPAQIIGLSDRGYLREGYKADIVVFDYDELSAPATIMEPDLYPTGIEYVIANGQFTVDGGRPTGALPGVVLDRRKKGLGRQRSKRMIYGDSEATRNNVHSWPVALVAAAGQSRNRQTAQDLPDRVAGEGFMWGQVAVPVGEFNNACGARGRIRARRASLPERQALRGAAPGGAAWSSTPRRPSGRR